MYCGYLRAGEKRHTFVSHFVIRATVAVSIRVIYILKKILVCRAGTISRASQRIYILLTFCHKGFNSLPVFILRVLYPNSSAIFRMDFNGEVRFYKDTDLLSVTKYMCHETIGK